MRQAERPLWCQECFLPDPNLPEQEPTPAVVTILIIAIFPITIIVIITITTITITTITDIAIITIIIIRVTVQMQEKCLTEAKVAALAGSFKNIKKSFFLKFSVLTVVWFLIERLGFLPSHRCQYSMHQGGLL